MTTSPAHRLETVAPTGQTHYVNGAWAASADGATFDGVSPVTGEPAYSIADAAPDDVDRAVGAARAAFAERAWRGMTQTRRGALLRRLADLVLERVDDFARIETLDNGKLLRETTGQVARVPEFFYYHAGMADKILGTVVPATQPQMLNYTLREPIGVVGAIIPWNSPLQLAAMKLAPALACGNTVVLKPSEHASASLVELMPLFEEAGFPPGVVNLVTGRGGAGAALAEHPLVGKVAFTGGTETGKKVAMAAASHLAGATLELGGKSPQLVFDDADVDEVIKGLLGGVFSAGGQTCVAGSRAFVHAALYEEVCERVAARADAMRVGDPLDASTDLGPLAIEAQRDKVEHYVGVAHDEGATLRAGGLRPDDLPQGWFYRPTVFADVRNDMAIAREEIFGPVLGVGRFESDEEALQLANDTRFGLAAGIWTNDLRRAHTLAAGLDTGTVWVNTYRSLTPVSPFGGVKDSGMGRENGADVVLEYTRVKSVWVNLAKEPSPDPFPSR